MTEFIDIDDILKPRLTPEQELAMTEAENNPVEVSVERILESARARTGLSDFGPQDFLHRLNFIVDEWNSDPEITAYHRAELFETLSRYATTRLLAQDYVTRHPDVHDEVIDRPIIIVGLPRSGTTHLLNMLAADSRLRSLPHWEALEPLPNPKEPTPAGGPDPRYTRCAAQWEARLALAPLSAAMHPWDPDHISEDYELMCPDFASFFFEWVARGTKWRDFYRSTDQAPHYQYMKTMLKILQHGKPKRRWIIKSPQHIENLRVLKDTFPDATVAFTYRDPVDAIQSGVTTTAYLERMRYPQVKATSALEYWIDRVEKFLRAFIRERELWPESQRVDVPFEALMKDKMAFAHAVQTKAGLGVSEQSDREIAAFLNSHPRGKNGQLIYQLKRDFGVDPDELRQRFAFYFEAFPFVKAG